MKDKLVALAEALYPSSVIRYRLMKQHRSYERELWCVPHWVSKKSTAIDVGGNRGIWSLQLARYARHVHTFEPNPICLKQLNRVVPSNVTIYPYGLSSQSGQAKLRFDLNNTGIGTVDAANTLSPEKNPGIKKIEECDVEIRRLDAFDFENLDFIKIDVEGHELAVLQGALRLLEIFHPTILVEIEERHNPGNFSRVTQFLSDLEYECCILNDDGSALELFTDPEKSAAVSLQASNDKPYINTFVFRLRQN